MALLIQVLARDISLPFEIQLIFELGYRELMSASPRAINATAAVVFIIHVQTDG
jgi:hypothetical protein